MQCFKVFWTVPEEIEEVDQVDKYINEPIAEMLNEGWRIVNVQSNISSPVGGTRYSGDYPPYLAVSVLFENDK